MQVNMGNVTVHTSNGGPLSAEQWAEIATSKLCSISLNMPTHVRQQAFENRRQIKAVIEDTIKKALQDHHGDNAKRL